VPKYDYDLFTIGAGSGGVAASRRAGAYGARVGICEERRVGGTCVLRGCVPKKLMWYASHVRDELDDAGGYGWSVDGTVNWAALVQAKRKELDRLGGIYLSMLANAGVDLVEGRGVIVDPHTVEVEGRRITAERILVATGGWPTMPEIPGIRHAMNSNHALDLETVPKHVAIVGGGYIGVEFAGIWHGAGAKITQIIRSGTVLRGFDEDIRTHLAEQMQLKGIELMTGNHVNAIEKTADGLNLRLDRGEHLKVDAVLFATGRHPHSHQMGLAEVGVKRNDEFAIIVDEWSRTSVPSIWAVGDVTHRVKLTPVAIADGRAFVETEFNDNPTPVDHDAIPTAVFSQPPVATVGLTEEQAKDLGTCEVACYRSSFRPMKYVLPGRQEKAFLKLVTDCDSGQVLGIHMVGPDAPEIIQGFAVALKAGATKQDFDNTVGIHPTSAEEFVTMYQPG
jgi:glutathione reductase (NADPH)